MNRRLIDNYLGLLTNKLQLDVRYFIRGGAWLSLPFVVNYLLGLIRTIAFARLIDQSVYGQFGFVGSLASTVGLLSLPGINTALTETVARGNHGSLFDAAYARGRWGILTSFVIGIVSLYYLYTDQPTLTIALLAVATLLPFTSAFQVVQGYFNGRKQFDKLSLMTTASTMVSTLFLLMVAWFQKELVWLVVANYGSQLLISMFFFYRAASTTENTNRDPQMVPYGRSLTWAGAISAITFEIDGVLLGFTAGFVDVAVYNIAAVFPESLKNFMKAFGPLVMPKIAEQPNKIVYSSRTRQKLLYLFILNLIIVVSGIFILPIVIPLLYGQDYTPSIRFSQLLMLSLSVGLLTSFFNAALQARKQSRSIYYFNIIYGILQISSLVIFVPLWGILGIIISRIITRLGSTLYLWLAVRKI